MIRNDASATYIVSEVAQEYLRLGACGLFSFNSSVFLPTRGTTAGFGVGAMPVVVNLVRVSMASRSRGNLTAGGQDKLVRGSCYLNGRSASPHDAPSVQALASELRGQGWELYRS